ncbi:MAG: DUF11 domain-containing protein, partial [Methanoregula sp.]|nr:DUF11 domain-containing protein [Methanoregula sp.]
TTFSTSGTKVNNVTITALDEMDPEESDNTANATVQVIEPDITPPPGTADLTISKAVSSSSPYNLGDEVTWVVTLLNKGPGNATNISVTEDFSGLTGLMDLQAIASVGDYNSATGVWNITELKNDTTATLTLTTTFSTAGTKKNEVTITALNETDPNPDDNSDDAIVPYNVTEIIPGDSPVSANLVIRPTTLNLNSKGVFTVYVTIADFANRSQNEFNKPQVDSSSTLACEGAERIRVAVSNKDGGTLIAKFHRYDLENVTSGEGVKINCSGTLVVDGEAINVEGSDTIRVMGEKKGLDKILSGLWKFLGVEKDDVEINESEDGNITMTLTLNPDNFRNAAQERKALKNNDESADRTGNKNGPSFDTRGEKDRSSRETVNDKQNKGNNAVKVTEKGNNDNERDGGSDGKSNGKKNS